MRTGLVFVGVAFLVVGATALAALYAFPNPTAQSRHDTSSVFPVFTGRDVSSPLMWGENGSGASFSLRWSSSIPVSASLWGYPVCSPGCAGNLSPPFATWNDATSGTWQSHGTPTYPYRLAATPVGNGSGTVSVVTTSTLDDSGTAAAVQLLVGTVAASLILVVGGVSAFLGLFLRAHPYAPPPEPLPRSAEAVEDAFPSAPRPPRPPSG